MQDQPSDPCDARRNAPHSGGERDKRSQSLRCLSVEMQELQTSTSSNEASKAQKPDCACVAPSCRPRRQQRPKEDQQLKPSNSVRSKRPIQAWTSGVEAEQCTLKQRACMNKIDTEFRIRLSTIQAPVDSAAAPLERQSEESCAPRNARAPLEPDSSVSVPSLPPAKVQGNGSRTRDKEHKIREDPN